MSLTMVIIILAGLILAIEMDVTFESLFIIIL